MQAQTKDHQLLTNLRIGNHSSSPRQSCASGEENGMSLPINIDAFTHRDVDIAGYSVLGSVSALVIAVSALATREHGIRDIKCLPVGTSELV
jgi:hypothetical protein